MSGEQYQGVKFKTVFLSSTLPELHCYSEFLQWNHVFAEQGLAPVHELGSYGNMSFRVRPGSNEFIITRTSASLELATIDDFVLVSNCDFESFEIAVHGCCEPSSETFIHAQLYEQLPHIHAIFHGHSDFLLQMASIPTTPEELPYGTLQLMNAALQLKNHSLFNLKNHGFFSLGTSIDSAGQQVMSLIRES